MAYKISLDVVLKHLDTRNMEVYRGTNERGEVERKEFDRMLAYILPVWFTGIASSPEQFEMVIKFNEHANTSWRELKDHPELQTKLLAALGPGKKVRHLYYRRDTTTTKQPALAALLRQRYSELRDEEIGLWCYVNNEAALKDLCDQYGVQEQERDGIITEYRRIVS